MNQDNRPDKKGSHRAAFNRNKKIILATQTNCGICGQLVDMNLKYPNDMAACVDHIIPVSKNGHPSAMENLQLAHWRCNRDKSDKVFKNIEDKKPIVIGNRNLPQSLDWAHYRSK